MFMGDVLELKDSQLFVDALYSKTITFHFF